MSPAWHGNSAGASPGEACPGTPAFRGGFGIANQKPPAPARPLAGPSPAEAPARGLSVCPTPAHHQKVHAALAQPWAAQRRSGRFRGPVWHPPYSWFSDSGKIWPCADSRHHTNCRSQSRAHQEETLERGTTWRDTAFGRTRPGRPSGRIVAQAPLRQRLRQIVRQWCAKLERPP